MAVYAPALLPKDAQESNQLQGSASGSTDLEKIRDVLQSLPNLRSAVIPYPGLSGVKSQIGSSIEELLREQTSQRHEPTLREQFESLAAEWKADHIFTSSPTEVALHDSYQRIIGMGPAALPFILNDLSNKCAAHWLWALQAITGEDAVLPENRGPIDVMCEDWRRWGRRHGYRC